MKTRLITRYRIFKLTHESAGAGHRLAWSFKPLVGEEHHEFESKAAAHEEWPTTPKS